MIFAIQPMFAKMALPRLGGSPSVWSVAMAVFQTALLTGYVYAHLLTRSLTPRRAAFVHLAFLAVVAMTLPLGIARSFGTPPNHWVMLWLVALFFASIRPPTHSRAKLGDLPAREGWRRAASDGVAPWTDDHSNVLGALVRQEFAGHRPDWFGRFWSSAPSRARSHIARPFRHLG